MKYRIYFSKAMGLYGIEVHYPADLFPIREKPLFLWKDQAGTEIDRRRGNYEQAIRRRALALAQV